MISKQTLTKEWIDQVSKANRNADKILVEKVIRALLLLEGLGNSGLTFIFKGGTALMLLLDSAQRLSIDIDIILSEIPDKLDEIMKSVAEKQGFSKTELQNRNTESEIKKEHFKFFYTPVHKTHEGDDYVLLDILVEANNYKNISAKKIESQFVHTTGRAIEINVPSFEDLLGDKLTAFAPYTTGVPYIRNENSMSMEIIKQLYDIGNLFDKVNDLVVIKTTFRKIVKTEIKYRNLKEMKDAKVLEDIYQTALCISLRGADGRGNFPELLRGIQRVTEFIFSESYHLEKAISHAAKAAYLSRLIATDQKVIEKFADPKQVVDAIIGQPYNTKLNKLRKSNPEAFFYWWKATLL